MERDPSQTVVCLGFNGVTLMRKLVVLMIVAAGLAVSACNTVKGAGQDVSAAGHAVSDTACDANGNNGCHH
jgi:predicted small secreted protein